MDSLRSPARRARVPGAGAMASGPRAGMFTVLFFVVEFQDFRAKRATRTGHTVVFFRRRVDAQKCLLF